MKVIKKVVVGSRLHGLNNDTSDWDYRGIYMDDLKSFLSPFKKNKTTSWIEGDIDDTSYELADFCFKATKGNATILEVFFSDKVEESSTIAEEMRQNWEKFIDTNYFVMASRGYAHNQLNKMELFENKGIKGQDRTPKFAVAYCRVLWQCAEFLKTGQFSCYITDSELREFLLKVKHDWKYEYVPELTERFSLLQGEVSRNWAKAEILKPDIEWIEDFIYRAYMGEIK